MKYEARDAEIVWERMGDESLLIDLRVGVYYSFRKGYSALLDALMEGWEQTEILEKANSSEQVKAALDSMVAFLLKENLVVEAPERQVNPHELALNSMEFPEIERFDDLQEIFEMDPIHDGDLERGWPVAP